MDTIIVGAGQAGLALSYYLTQKGHSHVVLERAAQAGYALRTGRWDSFTLVTPNWSVKMPGDEYQGPDPDGFMGRTELLAYLEQYGEKFKLPIKYNSRVQSVEPDWHGSGFLVKTNQENYRAANVVIATGLFQRPKKPVYSAKLPESIQQYHPGDYHNPKNLPDGAVLVVGSGQSGCQIAEELYQAGRVVYLSTGRAGRIPRRYRGQDFYFWANAIGYLDRTAASLGSPHFRFLGDPHLTGKDGGRTLNLHCFARDGVVLLGHIYDIEDGKVRFAPDVLDNLAHSDHFESQMIRAIDQFIDKKGLNTPPEKLSQLRYGYKTNVHQNLDLKEAGIQAVIWATGYQFDYRIVRLPIFDYDGYPIQKQGLTNWPGLYFIGLPWLVNQKSGLLLGVGQDAAYIASQIISHRVRA
ncbi:MAG: NAD(P)-binding domain-containing protein [Anaerolineaceae bacterium]|nr:NAD(P)-binding domain-containing protein [Anaerolineaceae bacterium]